MKIISGKIREKQHRNLNCQKTCQNLWDGVLDAKAKIKVGPFSRGGYSRQHKEGIDHDFDPDVILGLFGFFLPEYDDTHFFFSKSKITADFIVDTLEILWVKLKKNTKSTHWF